MRIRQRDSRSEGEKQAKEAGEKSDRRQRAKVASESSERRLWASREPEQVQSQRSERAA